MKPAFWAKEDQLVPVPGYRPAVGTPQEYVGRKLVLSADGKRGALVPTEEPYVCEGDEATARLVHLTRRDACLIPANEEAAALCGVPFVPHALVDGAMAPVVSNS